MTIKVLAIGDIGNIVKTIQNYVKKSEIYLINYPFLIDNLHIGDEYQVRIKNIVQHLHTEC